MEALQNDLTLKICLHPDLSWISQGQENKYTGSGQTLTRVVGFKSEGKVR